MLISENTEPLEVQYNGHLPILVVGLPGIPGYNAFFYLRKLFPGQVIGMVPPNAVDLLLGQNAQKPSGFLDGMIQADPESPDEIARLFESYPFKTVVDASGWCALKPCELDPALGRRLNVDLGVNIMRAAKRVGARLIRLSTDLVFDGLPYTRNGQLTEGDYLEDWPVSPITMYGKFMAESESLLLADYPETAILRIALPMGPSPNGHAGAIDWIESRFRKGRPATLYFDEVRSNLYVQDLNRVLLRFIKNKVQGLYHVGGPLRLSLYQIAQVINKVGNYPQELLMGCLRAAAGPMPPRAGNVTMNTDKLVSLLGSDLVKPWPFEKEYIPPHSEWHRQREADFPEAAVAAVLYGYGWPEAWEHPKYLIPE
jgi:dTDP-4-dehydrorhamnose reductase